MKILIKKSLALLLQASGIVEKLIKRRSYKEFVILMYHRVLPNNAKDIAVQPGMYVLQQTLEMQLAFLRKHFLIWPLSKLKEISHKIRSSVKPICFITFDDGWHDFYNYAYPTLTSHSAPATVFIPTGYIGTEKWFWPNVLLNIFKESERKKYQNSNIINKRNNVVMSIEKLRGNFVERTEKAIDILKKIREEEIECILNELSKQWNIEINMKSRAFLNWKEIIDMRASGIIEYGSHTVNHKILKILNDTEIEYELETSRKTLIQKNAMDDLFKPFCYPSGIYDDHILKMVKAARYDVAVTTQKGWNTVDTYPFELRRIGMHEDMTSTKALFACRIAELI